MRTAALIFLVVVAAAAAQAQEEPDEPEPAPEAPPPVIYVPPPLVVPPPPAPPPSRPSTGGFLARLDLGAAYRYALKESFGALALHVQLGGENRSLAFAGLLDIELGASKAGLFYSTIDWGFEMAGRLGSRLRLGIGPHFGLMIIRRATEPNAFWDMTGFLLGITADVSVDLVRFRSGALLVYGRVGYDFVDTGPLSSYSNGFDGQLGLGVRL